jgi:azurin
MTTMGLGLTSGITLVACGGGDSAAPGQAPAAPAAGSGGDVVLAIGTVGETSKFDKENLEAPAGSKITLKFTNNGPSAKEYNWVLTQPGKQLAVVNNGLAEDANGYVKPGDPNVIAHTKLIKGGESDTVTFDAPPPGEYPYICTSPGLYALMKGVLTIK